MPGKNPRKKTTCCLAYFAEELDRGPNLDTCEQKPTQEIFPDGLTKSSETNPVELIWRLHNRIQVWKYSRWAAH